MTPTQEIKAIIGQYSDYFSHWFGLRDGTMLPVSDESGKMWVKVYGETMTVEEFNARD